MTCIGEKTLVAWVTLANLEQAGGGVLSLDTLSEQFDAIVFGEIEPGRWMAGSDNFRRSSRDQASRPGETAAPTELLQIAVAYGANRITIYRNGALHASEETDNLQAFGPESIVLIGLRHLTAPRETSCFAGAIADARIYDRALTAGEIASIEPGRVGAPAPLAWWDFTDGVLRDRMGRFPETTLAGNAHIENGRLVLDGKGSFLAASSEGATIARLANGKHPGPHYPAMLYRPARGAMWDPSIVWHNGRYHAFMMYSRDTARGLDAGHCLKAVSEDGVHWRDEAVVIEEPERERGCLFFKCMVARCGDRFIMDHGVLRPEGQDMLRFHESRDLRNWTLLFSSRPDPRWYGLPPDASRWDHMYILPKEEGSHGEGYWGYPVAVARQGQPRGVGMMQSPDGREWGALPPAEVEWGDIPPVDLEWGGCERIDGRYYLIGGGCTMGFSGYGMFAFVADAPRGPFRPIRPGYRLCGSSRHHIAWLATWCRGNGELLISNYASMQPGDFAPWLLPLRKPVVDPAGQLRLAWWPGNEALKGVGLPIEESRVALEPSREPFSVAWLDTALHPEKGLVLEGRIRANLPRESDAEPQQQPPACGLVLEESDGQATAILFGVGAAQSRETRVSRLLFTRTGTTAETLDVTGEHCATVTGIDADREHSFRLLVRGSLFELYVNDFLAQTFYWRPGTGRVGFVTCGANAHVTELKAWGMSL